MTADGFFGASGTLTHPLTVLDGGRRISARGIPVDAITFLTPPMGRSDKPDIPLMPLVLYFAAHLCHRLKGMPLRRDPTPLTLTISTMNLGTTSCGAHVV